jgi:hypothetical protein
MKILDKFRSSNQLLKGILSTIIVILIVYMLLPDYILLTPHFSGLDPSWTAYLAYATQHKLLYGKEVIFTYGPLNQVLTHLYSAKYWWFMSCLTIVVMTYVILLIDILQLPRALFMLFISYYFIWTDDSFIFATFFLIVYWLMFFCDKTFIKQLIVLSLAIFLQVKFTFAVMAIIPVIILCYRKDNLSLLLLPVYFFCLWFILQANLQVLDYFINSFSIADGYNWGMQNYNDMTYDWRNWRAIGVVLEILILCGVSSYYFFTKQVLLGLLILCTTFLPYKEGIVRADGHELYTFQFIFFVSIFMILTRYKINKRINIEILMYCALCTMCFAYFMRKVDVWRLPTITHNYFYAKTNQQQNYEMLHKHNNLPVLPGCSDLYPYDLLTLLFSGNKFCIRPVFQSYSSYDSRLLKLNLQHLIDVAPDNIFWGIQPIDNRYPAQDDSLSWPKILADYRMTDKVGEYLVLQRKSEIYNYFFSNEHIIENTKLGMPLVNPFLHHLVWVQINIAPSLMERLIAILYKPNLLNINISYTDGSTQTYRLLPRIAKAGFLLSPTVSNIGEFACINKNLSQGSKCGKEVASFTVDTNHGSFRGMYAIKSVAFSRLSFKNQSISSKNSYEQRA